MNKFFKRLFDIVASASGLIILSPVFLILVYLIRKNLGSPVFFIQERPGKDGKPFKMIKFRSMRDAIDKDGNPLPDSERLTDFGKKLRATSLDEAVYIAGTVVRVRQQGEDFGNFVIDLAVSNRFLQCHIVGQCVGNRLHGVGVNGIDGDVAAFGDRHHFGVGDVAGKLDAVAGILFEPVQIGAAAHDV